MTRRKLAKFLGCYFTLIVLFIIPVLPENKKISSACIKIMSIYFKFIALLRKPINGKNVIHYLHIGKTGGRSIKHAIRSSLIDFQSPGQNIEPNDLLLRDHAHSIKLIHFSNNSKYIFSIRDPIDKFYSSFYSRKRMSRPRILNTPYPPGERIAFKAFEHATYLAEALSSEDIKIRKAAIFAMLNIRHINSHLLFWFTREQLDSHPPVFLFEQKTLDKDFEDFKIKVGVDDIFLPKEDFYKQKGNYTRPPPLSELAIKNLKEWYSTDILIYEYLLSNKEKYNS